MYKAQADDLHAGREPRDRRDVLLVKELANRFLTTKTREMASGDVGPRMFNEYRGTTDWLVAQLGKNRAVEDLTADDFEMLRATLAERFGPVRLSFEIQKVRTVFKYAYDRRLVDAPVRYDSFKKPSVRVLRQHRKKNGSRMLEADECRKLVGMASGQVKAIILLGLNCGYGNADCAALPIEAVDLETGWIDFPRPKTLVDRRCPLWPETIVALREVLANRREPRSKEHGELLFITAQGHAWFDKVGRANPVGVVIRRLMRRCGVHRPGLGAYTFRRVFRTIADGARDPVAIDLIMGHADNTMGATYRQRIADERLLAVTEHVRQWLWPEA